MHAHAQQSSVQPPALPTPSTLTLRQRLRLAYPLSARILMLVYLAYAALAFAIYAFSSRTGTDVSLCTFKRFTGHPCATCGGTRAAVRLAHLDPIGALEYNPFATFLLLSVAAWFVISFVRAGRPLIRWTARRRSIAGALVVAALLINWAYVWKTEPELTARDQAARDQAARQQAPDASTPPRPFSIPR